MKAGGATAKRKATAEGKRMKAMLMAMMTMAVSVAMAADPAIDPKAEAAVARVSETMQQAKRMSCTMTMDMLNEMEGMRQEITTTYSVAAERPAKFAMRYVKGLPTFTVISDGRKLSSYLAMMKRYAVTDAPKTYEELFQAVGALGANMMFVDNLMRDDVKAALMEGVKGASCTGTEMVDGKECEHLKFTQDEFDWELWVTTGKTALVVKVVTDMSKGMGKMEGGIPGMKAMKMTFINRFTDWSLNAELPAGTFEFKAPEGAVKTGALFGDAEEGQPEAEGLTGKPAPAFTLELLGGGKASVPAENAGKTVVVLDFWATWCGPCRRALPVVANVTAEFKDKGVVFYAVNQQEQAADVKSYLEKEKIACPVALDADGKVGKAYQVQGIPQTVLIGKDGTVQAVHIGLIPDLEKTLRKQIETLVEGKSLIGERHD